MDGVANPVGGSGMVQIHQIQTGPNLTTANRTDYLSSHREPEAQMRCCTEGNTGREMYTLSGVGPMLLVWYFSIQKLFSPEQAYLA